MRTLSRFWRAVESLSTLATVRDRWQALLAEEMPFVQEMLRPRQARATSYPRLAGGLPFEVIEHAPDHIVGVCQETGIVIELRPEQLIVYEVDRLRLGQKLVQAAGLEGPPELLGDSVLAVGTLRTDAVPPQKVYLATPQSLGEMPALASRLIAERKAPFILLSPYSRPLRDAEMMLQSHGCRLVPLAHAIEVLPEGRWRFREPLLPLAATGDKQPATVLTNVFQKTANRWFIRFQGKTAEPNHLVGLDYIAYLLEKKRRPISALLLVAVVRKTNAVLLEPALKGIDRRTVQNYQEQYDDLDLRIKEAERNQDVETATALTLQFEQLAQAFSASTGLGGVARKVDSRTERARKSVSESISYAIKKLHATNPSIANHLESSLHLGAELIYDPNPNVDWEF